MIGEPEPESGIVLYLHCKKCLREIPEGEAPRDFSRTQAGIGPQGELIVWCNRHNMAVCVLHNKDIGNKLLDFVSGGCGHPGHPLAH